jgi:hypothetical protein
LEGSVKKFGKRGIVMKKLFVLVLTFLMVFGLTSTVYADPAKSWNAGKGTAVVDGQKDDVYAGAQEMKMEAVSDTVDGKDVDDSAASTWAVYDNEAIYFFVEVADSSLDDASANVYEKDSIELRIDNKDTLVQAYAVDESFTGAAASECKVLKTDKGYNVEFKIPYATAEGSSMKFSVQVNCAKDGGRNHTLHTSDDLKDAWQNNDVYENLVFSSGTAADVPKTGVVSLDFVYGIGAVVTAIGAFSLKGKRK